MDNKQNISIKEVDNEQAIVGNSEDVRLIAYIGKFYHSWKYEWEPQNISIVAGQVGDCL